VTSSARKTLPHDSAVSSLPADDDSDDVLARELWLFGGGRCVLLTLAHRAPRQMDDFTKLSQRSRFEERLKTLEQRTDEVIAPRQLVR
jgi:hypothetical protein